MPFLGNSAFFLKFKPPNDQGAIVDASIVDSPHAPDGSILIEVADDREDLRTEEEQAQEQTYQYELKSRKPGVDTEARWMRKGRHYRYGYKSTC